MWVYNSNKQTSFYRTILTHQIITIWSKLWHHCYYYQKRISLKTFNYGQIRDKQIFWLPREDLLSKLKSWIYLVKLSYQLSIISHLNFQPFDNMVNLRIFHPSSWPIDWWINKPNWHTHHPRGFHFDLSASEILIHISYSNF